MWIQMATGSMALLASFTANGMGNDVLRDFLKWTPVLEGDQAFESQGHGGIVVRAYLNSVAAEHATTAEQTYPMPVGSMLAKAVVRNADTPASAASRVYFMRKQAPGFDPKNGDWSYSLANRKGSKLVFDTSVTPKDSGCVSCHAAFKAFDHVKTVEFFKQQSTDVDVPAPRPSPE